MERKITAPMAVTSKKVSNPSNVLLSQNEIELKSLKGKFSDSGNDISAAQETTTTTATSIKGKSINLCVCH